MVSHANLLENQRALVATFARVRHAVPDARLELVGPVADAAYARALADDITRLRLADAGYERVRTEFALERGIDDLELRFKADG